MTMRPLQNQATDIAVFVLSVALLGFVTKMVRDMTADAMAGAKAPALLPAAMLPQIQKTYREQAHQAIESVQKALDETRKADSIRRIERILDRSEVERFVEGADDLREAIADYKGIEREGLTPEEYQEEKEAAFEAIAEAVDGLDIDEDAFESLEEEEIEKPPPVKPPAPNELRRKGIATLDRLIRDKQRDLRPPPSLSDARKAVYKDILNGFSTVQEAKDYVEGMPEDSVIFTARGDEISFTLIKVITADIERNPWLSPFKPERRDISWQPPLMPETKKERAGRCYELAWRHIINHGEGTLIHGEVWSHKLGRMIGHAWVETETGFIYEPVSDQYFEKDWLYKTYKVKEFNTYTPEQAAIMAARTKTHGPWTEAERKAFLKPVEYLPASIPRDELTRIADKYGWWAAKLAESVCPHNDVACVEREARRLVEARRARLE